MLVSAALHESHEKTMGELIQFVRSAMGYDQRS
jgi:hypothetical protein